MIQSEFEKFVCLLGGLDVFLSQTPIQSLFMCSLGERSDRKLGLRRAGIHEKGQKENSVRICSFQLNCPNSRPYLRFFSSRGHLFVTIRPNGSGDKYEVLWEFSDVKPHKFKSPKRVFLEKI